MLNKNKTEMETKFSAWNTSIEVKVKVPYFSFYVTIEKDGENYTSEVIDPLLVDNATYGGRDALLNVEEREQEQQKLIDTVLAHNNLEHLTKWRPENTEIRYKREGNYNRVIGYVSFSKGNKIIEYSAPITDTHLLDNAFSFDPEDTSYYEDADEAKQHFIDKVLAENEITNA